jgi:opacity protein-like surface antigen
MIAVLTLILTPSAWAQDYKVEFSGWFGYTFSEGFTIDPITIDGAIYSKINPTNGASYGFTFDVLATENVAIGFQYNQQRSTLQASGTRNVDLTDMNVNNYHAIFTYNFGDEDEFVRPFVLGGLGATQYQPADVQGNAVASSTRFSTTWAGGVKVYPGRNVGFKAAARWTPTYIKSDPAGIWCSPWWPWGCYQLVETDYSNQFELNAGITFRF